MRTLSLLLMLLVPLCTSMAARADGLSLKLLLSLESSRVRVRVAAVVAIGRSGDKKARRILEGMLRDQDARVRAASAESLGKLGDRKAIATLEEFKADKSKLVRRSVKKALALLVSKGAPGALARGQSDPASTKAQTKAQAGPAISVDIPLAQDLSGDAPPAVIKLLRQEVMKTLRNNQRLNLDVNAQKKKASYGLWLRVRSIEDGKQGAVNLVVVKCEMTLVAMPSKALRLQSSATAGAGMEATLNPALRAELLVDGVKACAPELAKDFIDYAFSRRAR